MELKEIKTRIDLGVCAISGFDFSRCRKAAVRDELMAMLPQNLKHLDLRSCFHITDDGLKSLPCDLEYLNLYHCGITDNGLRYLPKKLLHLNLWNCTEITDEGLKFIPPSLEFLNLTNCYEITTKGLGSLPKTIRILR